MASSPRARFAPRLDPITLAGLSDGDATSLAEHESFDALRFTSVDLSGRDLSGIEFTDCVLGDLAATELAVRSSRFNVVRLERLNAPIVSAARSMLRDVEMHASRIGSGEFYDNDWRGVHVTDSKLGFINLRGSRLNDVLFTNCTIDELDLGSVTAGRVAFVDTTVNVLDVTRAALTNVDFRGLEFRQITGFEGLAGSTLSAAQLADLTPIFASHFRLVIDGSD